MYARKCRYLSLIGCLLLAGAAWAEELALPIVWVEPTLLNLPDRKDSQLTFTRIQWRPWACIDQPPPTVRVEQYGKLTWCGFRSGMDVPASGPTGGQQQMATLVIPNANPAWERIEVRIIPFTAQGTIAMPAYSADIQYETIELTPVGELANPPIQLKLK